MSEKQSESISCSVPSESLQPHRLQLPGSSVHGISQARNLEWVAIPFSRGSSQPRAVFNRGPQDLTCRNRFTIIIVCNLSKSQICLLGCGILLLMLNSTIEIFMKTQAAYKTPYYLASLRVKNFCEPEASYIFQ